MIITRSPLRITLGGGGTDLPSYYKNKEGFTLSAAINKYVYISIHKTFQKGFYLKYSHFEKRKTIGQIKHPLIREALKEAKIKNNNLEIGSQADIPAGTGLGSSGSFTTALLKALYTHRKRHLHQEDLAELACHIEIDILGEPIGKQDQYASAFGGINYIKFFSDGAVSIEPILVDESLIKELFNNLLFVYLDQSHDSSSILNDVTKNKK